MTDDELDETTCCCQYDGSLRSFMGELLDGCDCHCHDWDGSYDED